VLAVVVALAGCGGGDEKPHAKAGAFDDFCRDNPAACGVPPARPCVDDRRPRGRVDGARTWNARHELLLTSDGGRTFRRACGPRGITGAIVVPRPGVLVAAAGRGVLRSTDSGRHWRRIALGGRVLALAARDGRAWALSRNCRRCGYAVHRSIDAGARWRSVRLRSQRSELLQTSPGISFSDARHGVASAEGYSTTNDGGRHWWSHPMPCGHLDSAYAAAGEQDDVWVVCGGQPGAGDQDKRLLRTRDGGNNWRRLRLPVLGYMGYLPNLVVAGRNTAYVPLERAGLAVTHDGGRSWRFAQGPSGVGDHTSIDTPFAVDHRRAWLTVQQRQALFSTTDAGRTWRRIRVPR
jgi:photosystem II stability/assembly factor-like uncharacterized protein